MRRRFSSSSHSSGQGRGSSSSYMSTDDFPVEHVDLGALLHDQLDPLLSEDTSGHVPSSHASPDPLGIRPFEPRVELRLDGSQMYAINHSQVSRKVTSCIKSHYSSCYPNWSHTPIVVRDLWFEEFKKLCWWEPELDGDIRQAFNKMVATCLSDTMGDVRKA